MGVSRFPVLVLFVVEGVFLSNILVIISYECVETDEDVPDLFFSSIQT